VYKKGLGMISAQVKFEEFRFDNKNKEYPKAVSIFHMRYIIYRVYTLRYANTEFLNVQA